MQYNPDIITLCSDLTHDGAHYAMILLRASRLQIILNSVRCYLDGDYLLCLGGDDRLKRLDGEAQVMHLRFHPYFYNVNLSHNIIQSQRYGEMIDRYGYPDFHLFVKRDERYFGLLPLIESEYRLIQAHFTRFSACLENCDGDPLWSCRLRSSMIAVLRLAEGIFRGEVVEEEGDDEEQRINAAIRYVQSHVGENLSLPDLCAALHTNRTTLNRLILKRTGMSTARYIRCERLNQSRPDLLFTRIPVEEIARKYGFDDASYYCRVFKQHFGVHPKAYRDEGWAKRIREEDFWHYEGDGRREMGIEAIAAREEQGIGDKLTTESKNEPEQKLEKGM